MNLERSLFGLFQNLVKSIRVVMFVIALFFCLIHSALAASPGSITLDAPVQSCLSSGRRVDLTWGSNLTEHPSYDVFRKLSSEAEASYAKIDSTYDLDYRDNTADSDKDYNYKIKATKDLITYSSLGVLAAANYCAPVLYHLESVCGGSGPVNNLSWTNVSGNLLKYEILRKNVTAGDSVFTKIGESSLTDYSDESNVAGTNDYKYAIRAIWQNTISAESSSASVTAFVCAPNLIVNSTCNINSPGGPVMNLSWNNLLGVIRYEIYRKAQSDVSFILLTSVSDSVTYSDNLVASLPFSYWNGGNVSYFIKAVWIKDALEVSESSTVQTQAISRCVPFVSVAGMCDAYNNPEMRLSWTRTAGADFYNLYRDDSTFVGQISGTLNSYTDYLNSATCTGGICTHSYRNEATVTGFSNFVSNTAIRNIDCVTVYPPSPVPVLNDFSVNSAYCESNKSKISLSWSSSANAIYYTLYRNGEVLINLSNTSYIDAGVESGIDYAYSVRAYGKAGTSTSMSVVKNIIAVSCVVPAVPVLVLTKSCNLNTPRVGLSWAVTDTENIVNYTIKRGLSVASLTTLATVDKTIFSKIDNESINPSTAYYYQVVANSVLGVSASPSLIKSITTDSCLPVTPVVTFERYCASGSPKVKVNWTITADTNIDHFEIFREDISALVPITTVAFGGTSYSWVDTNPLTQITLYKYKVVAVGQLNTKIATQGFKSVTTNDCVLPGAFALTDPPDIFCQGSYPRSKLSWAPSTNTVSYDLFRNRLNVDDSVAETAIFTNVTSQYSDIGFGNALNFTGSSSVDFGLTDLPLTGDLTIEFWANPSSVSSPSRQNPICKSYGGEFCLTMEPSGQLSYYHGSAGSNTSPYMSFSTSNVFENNKWVHVIITRNRATRTMKSYKNGNFANSTTWSSVYDPVTSTYNLFVGKGYVYNFKGIIDEVRIYNRVLSDTEAQDHYKGIYSDQSNLIGLWHFDEGAGSQYVSNSSDNKNNGVLGTSASADLADPVWETNGLQSNMKYSWQIRANGPNGVGSALTNITSALTMPICAPPKVGLEIDPICQTGLKSSVRLRWSYSINADKYEIYRKNLLTETEFTLIKTIHNIDPEFSLRKWEDNNNGLGLDSEVNYSYYIKAIGSTGLNTQSDNRSATSFLCVLPDSITNLAATPSCVGSYLNVNLTWDKADNIFYYNVYRNGEKISSDIPPSLSPSFLDTTAAVNTYYTYKVKATGPGGQSESDNEIMDPADWASNNNNFCMPSVPVITSINGLCLSNIAYNTISWSDATTFNSQQYKIYRNTINDFGLATLVRTIDKGAELALFNSRSWQNTGLLDDQDYFYWIKAIGPVGGLESTASLFSTRRTNNCTLPLAPTISESSIGNICSSYNDPVTILKWSKTLNTTSYNIYKNGSAWQTLDLDSNGYIKKWLVIGGFPYSHATSTPTVAEINTALADDYLGGEANVRPRAGKTYGGKTWFEYNVPSGNITDFTLGSAPMSALTPKTYATAYAFAYIYSSVARTGQLRVGSDDGVKAFVNGIPVYTNTVQRGVTLDQDTNNINLIAGLNTLLIKVQQGASGWGLSARITKMDGVTPLLDDITMWDSSAVANLSEDYKVYSVGPGGTSASSSNVVSSAPLDCDPLTPDVSLTPGCNGGNTQMTISWPADSNTNYWAIYKKRDIDPSFSLLNPPGVIMSSSYVDLNVASNATYDYYVKAFASGGITRTSNTKTKLVTTCYNSPVKPVITALPQCAGMTSRIKLNWAPYDNSNTLSFNVYRKDITIGDVDYTKIFENLSPSTTEFSDGNIIVGHNYSYRIEAAGSGVSNYSISDIAPSGEGVAIDCLNIPPFNPPMLNFNHSDYTISANGSVFINWSDTQNETKYKVYRRIKNSGPFAYQKQDSWLEYLKSFAGKESNAAYNNPIVTMLPGIDYIDPPISGFVNYIDYTVSEDTTYEYQVVAINNAGGIDAGLTYSNIISPVYVRIAVPIASDVSHAVIGPGRTKIRWVRPIPPLGNEYTSVGKPPLYEIQRSSTVDFNPGTITVLGTICEESGVRSIIFSGLARACSDEVPDNMLEYIDNNASEAEKYYRVVTENFGGRSESLSIVGYSNMRWKEVVPK